MAIFAVSLIFLTMVRGSFQPVLRRIWGGRRAREVHMVIGLLALIFILAHFASVAPTLGERWGTANRGFLILGPVALVLLLTTIGTALDRRRLPRLWRRVHFLNYAAFPIAILHGVAMQEHGPALFMRISYGAFLLLAFAGLGYRARSSGRSKKPRPSA